MSLSIYLHFNGNCREAFDFYREVFGSDYLLMSTFSDMPPPAADAPPEEQMGPMPEEYLEQVMHVSLPIGSSILMGSDVPPMFGPPRTTGDNFAVSFHPDSREDADEKFARLSDGGMVTMPMADQFWGDYFGSCVDKFGINWQVNYSEQES